MKNISTAMKVIFLTIHILFSLDFGFIQYRSFIQKVFLKSIFVLKNIILIILSCYLTYFSANFCTFLRNFFVLLKLFTIVLYLTFCNSEKTFYRLQTDLLSIDTKLSVQNCTYNMELKVFFYILLLLVYKTISIAFYCCYPKMYACSKILSALLIFMFANLANNVFVIISFFCFYSIYCRLQKLTTSVTKTRSSINAYQLVYQSIIVCAENVKQTVEVAVSTFSSH